MKNGNFELAGLSLRAIHAILGAEMPPGMKDIDKIPVPEPVFPSLTASNGNA